MSWRAIRPDRQPGQPGPGRKAAGEVVVYLHRTGKNPAAGMSLLFRFAPQLVTAAGIAADNRRVDVTVNDQLGLMRVALRPNGLRKMRPPHQRSGVRWMLSCSHCGELRALFPPQLFLKLKTVPLTVVEASSEGITLELPKVEGRAA